MIRLEQAKVDYYMALGENLFISNSLSFANRNTRLVTVSTETVRIAKYGPSKNQSKRSDLSPDYLAIE